MLLAVGVMAIEAHAQNASPPVADASRPAPTAAGIAALRATVDADSRVLDDANLVLLELRIDGFRLAESLMAYQAAQ